MKTVLFSLVLLLVAAGTQAGPKATPAPQLPPLTELLGEVRRVVPEGIIIKGTIEAPGETWDGVFLLTGYPKQSTAAIGDTVQHVWGRRGDNVDLGKGPLRVYEFVR